MATLKLYNRETGYKCKVNQKELSFLFGYAGDFDRDEINLFLANIDAGYYVK